LLTHFWNKINYALSHLYEVGKAYLADFHATNQSTVNLKTGSNVITLYGKYAEITYEKKANGSV